MGKVSFEEVKTIFSMGSVWTDDREEYWFQYAWSLLEKAQMTCYSNAYEEKTVHLYAVVLVAVYLEFCKITWDEDCTESLLLDIEEDFSALELGQLLKQFLKPGELVSDMEEAINEVVFSLQYRVFHALAKYASASDIFVWMYCTGFTPYFYDEDGDEVECEVESYEDYAKMIRDNYDEIMCAAASEGLPVDGFDYIHSLI